jgi:FixJ family two-component response regulator
MPGRKNRRAPAAPTSAGAVVMASPGRTRVRAKGRATPRSRRSRAATPPGAAAAAAAEVCHPVIVATADPSLTRMLAFALDQARLPHVEFQSGTVVLRELLAMPVTGHPTIVVLDVDLPGVDGHAILERLGVERPDTFLIVVLSSHADEAVQVRSLLAGALDHLAKPFNVRVLMAKLLRWTAIAARTQVAG